MTIIDRSRQYFSAAQGFDERETPLELSYCKHVMVEDEQIAVEDAREDAVFSAGPLADSEFRGYLGSPVRVDGERIGSFCVADPEARRWDDRQRRIIDDLAHAVSVEIELRIRLRKETEARGARRADRAREPSRARPGARAALRERR